MSNKALIVDDHPFIRATVKYLLKQEGFDTVFEAGNGADAMQIAREERPELVILDLAMPKLGGLEVISRSRTRVAEQAQARNLNNGVFFQMKG
jgi:two-component system response regulator EvgA